MTPMTLLRRSVIILNVFLTFFYVSIVDFEQVNVCYGIDYDMILRNENSFTKTFVKRANRQ